MNPINGTIPPDLPGSVPPVAGNSTVLPVNIDISGDELQITLQGKQFTLQTIDVQQQLKLMLQQGNAAALELQNPLPEVMQGRASQLLVLAEAIQIKLPDALTQLASQNGIPMPLLMQLASRPQGYPLPPVTVEKNDMRFAGGTVITIPQNVKLPTGQYLAKVVADGETLQLKLEPVTHRFDISLKATTNAVTATPATPAQVAIVTCKPDISAIFSHWIKSLEQVPATPIKSTADTASAIPMTTSSTVSVSPETSTPASATQSVDMIKTATASNTQGTTVKADTTAIPLDKPLPLSSQSQPSSQINKPVDIPSPQQTAETPVNVAEPPAQTAGTLPASLNFLQKAFNKLGAVPRTELHAMEVKQNVASELLKLLPALQPKPLSNLAEPVTLMAEMAAQMRFQPSAPITAPNATQSDAVSTILQLLIGVKAFSQQQHISPRLRQYLQALQTRINIAPQLLQALQNNDSLENVNHMAQSIRLYQQASADNQGQCWYVTLPYYLDQRQEQLEAKFEHTAQGSEGADKRSQWQLQLKFNLSGGALLAKAQMQNHSVNLHFIGSSQLLIDKVSNHFAALSTKLTQIGLTPAELSAHVAPVPATLLPGDHYLVQIKA